MSQAAKGLDVRNLRKSYRNRLVIRDVSVSLNRGEVVALLGPNGSGKTTCFYCIAGLVTPDAGQVAIDGRDATRLPMFRRARMGIGYLPQEMSIFRGLTVEQNIMAVLEVAVADPRHRRDRLGELLADFSITHKMANDTKKSYYGNLLYIWLELDDYLIFCNLSTIEQG